MFNLFLSDITIHWIALLSGIVITTSSQILLKKGVTREKTFIESLINVKTVTGGILFGIVTILNVYAMQKIELKTVTAWVGSSYALIPIFSRLFLKEYLDLSKIVGSILILFGILVFNF